MYDVAEAVVPNFRYSTAAESLNTARPFTYPDEAAKTVVLVADAATLAVVAASGEMVPTTPPS